MRNWYVITGGPSAGKTTLIKALEERGFHTEHESARILIDEGLASGKTVDDIRSDEYVFQMAVYKHKQDREARLDPEELIFFDRGMQDTHAYLTLHGLDIDEQMQTEMDNTKYKKAFLLEPFKYEEDYARTESREEQEQLFALLHEAYRRAGVPVEVVPTFPTKQERIDHFFNYLRTKENIPIPVL